MKSNKNLLRWPRKNCLKSTFFVICWQTWPIFARGGDYGPRYDVSNESQKRSVAASEVSGDDNEWYYNPLSKKDLESLIHQPNPALTVQQLPQNPKISFRKGHPSEKKGKVSKTI